MERLREECRGNKGSTFRDYLETQRFSSSQEKIFKYIIHTVTIVTIIFNAFTPSLANADKGTEDIRDISSQSKLFPSTSDASNGPYSLKDCLNRAMSGNPLLMEARLGSQSGEKAISSAAGKHYPKLSLDGNYTRRQDPWPYIPAQSLTTPPYFSDEFANWNVVMTVPLYQGGQITNGVKLAEIRKGMQDDNLELTRNEIIANVVNTYNKILQLKKLREASRSSVDALDSLLKNAQQLFKVGRTAKIDLLKVEVQRANEKQRLLSLDEAITTSFETLRYLMGDEYRENSWEMTLSDPLAVPVFTQESDPGLAFETAKRSRPEYLLAQKNIIDAGISSKISTGKLLPSVGAFAGYIDQYGFEPWHDEANWYTGINFNMPLFEKSLYADVARDRILKQKADKHLQVVENQIRLDIRSASSAIEESRNRILTTQKAVEQSRESFRIEELRYKSGAGAVVDLLLAQSAYVTSEANYSQALFDYNAALVAFRKATGTLEEYLR